MIRKENSFGWLVVLATLALTWVIWLTTLHSYSFVWEDPFLFLSKLVVLPGTVLMCWAFFLTTRFPIFGRMFKGLDKAYHAHKLMSITSFILICLHPVFQVFRFVPDLRNLLELFSPGRAIAVDYGIFALIVFITLFSLTLWIKLPYHIWKRTHEFFILVLLLAAMHIWLIKKQIAESPLLFLWIYGFIGLAFLAYLYTRFLYRFLGPRFEYEVARIERLPASWNIYFNSAGPKTLSYLPAQFVYVSFKHPILGDESHPYSTSSAPHQMLRLSIKSLGDYTEKLDTLAVGDKATIWGPYGRFSEKYLAQPKKDAILIAGGIGITPFLSILQYEVKHPSSRNTFLFYGVSTRKENEYLEEIEEASKKNPHIKRFVSYFDEAPITVQMIEDQLSRPLKKYNYFLCGPIDMMKFFEHELKKRGVKNHNIVFEDFNLFD